MKSRVRRGTTADRGVKQERSIARKTRIADAAIEVIAEHGIDGVTHRLVAERAGVSLAATTYYFDTRFDILAAASKLILDGYAATLQGVALRMRESAAQPDAFRRLAVRLVRSAAVRDHTRTKCWAEILLDARRHPESMALAHQWFAELDTIWLEMAAASHARDLAATARSGIDHVVGLLFITLALGLGESQIDAVLEEGRDPIACWQVSGEIPESLSVVTGRSRKAAETRERILSSTVELLVSDGPAAITYRAVALRAGLTAAGPFYHFPTLSGLLAAAQQRIFAASKERYREVVGTERDRLFTTERLVDRTAAVLLREATAFAGHNLATYAIWIGTDREPRLRPVIWNIIKDQHLAWQHVLGRLMPQQRPLDAVLAQALFVGKLVRLLATGSRLEDLALIRDEFSRDLGGLVKGEFWF
jgi:AcrR family transcriptional regulator